MQPSTQAPTPEPQPTPDLDLAAQLAASPQSICDQDPSKVLEAASTTASAMEEAAAESETRPADKVEQSPRRDRQPDRLTPCRRRLTISSARVSQRIGGPLGRYAATGTAWWNPLRVALLVGTLVYLSGVVFRLPCRITVAGQPPPDHFKYLCYSDIGLLYAGRGLLQGNTPYLDSGGYPIWSIRCSPAGFWSWSG